MSGVRAGLTSSTPAITGAQERAGAPTAPGARQLQLGQQTHRTEPPSFRPRRVGPRGWMLLLHFSRTRFSVKVTRNQKAGLWQIVLITNLKPNL